MENLLRLEDLAEITGYSVVTLRRWLKQGSGPKYRKAGRFYLFLPSDVSEWIQSLGPDKRQ